MASDPAPTRLGRGLDSMFDEVADIKAGSKPSGAGYMRIPITEIRSGQFNRVPNQHLCESVKKLGVLQPVLVALEGANYKLLAGSRRLQAASKAGLTDVPAIVIPSDRAGSLDVYLEENLSRIEFNESERAALRNQWMRETGRDEEQAAKRIPDTAKQPISTTAAPSAQTSRITFWRAATSGLGLICITLLLILSRSNSNVVYQAAPPTQPERTTDVSWMNQFPFPGTIRSMEGDTLAIRFAKPMFSNEAALTPSARIFFFQLAAIVDSSSENIHIEITGYGENYSLGLERATAAASLLQGEGVPEARLTADGSSYPNHSPGEKSITVVLRSM